MSRETFCSFCGLRHDKVFHMMAGPCQVYICDKCVACCSRLVTAARAKAGQEQSRTLKLVVSNGAPVLPDAG